MKCRKITFEEYKKIADNTKRNDSLGKKFVDMIDDFRQKFLPDTRCSPYFI